jgi:hypothetical protein
MDKVYYVTVIYHSILTRYLNLLLKYLDLYPLKELNFIWIRNNGVINYFVEGAISIDLDAVGEEEVHLEKVATRTAVLCFR